MTNETEDEAITVNLDGDGAQPAQTGSEDAAVADLASQFKELQGNLEREKQARVDADRRADEQRRVAEEARQREQSARTEATDHQYQTVETGISAAQSEATAAEQAYAAAMEAGNFGEAAKAQRRIAQAEARILRFEEAKADLEARRVEKPKEQARPAQQDPIDAFIDSRSEPSKRWLREHRDLLTDQRKSLKLTAAHNDALAEGIAADSDAYFEHVEKFLGLRESLQPQQTNGATKPTVPTKRATAPPAAPVSGSGGGMTSSPGGRTVTLTKAEAAAATDGTLVYNYDDPNKKFKKGDPIGVQEFARRKLELQRQGAYDRSYTES